MKFFAFHAQQGGFTIPEVLVVVGILIVIGSIALPLYNGFVSVAYTENASRDFVESLRRANSKARASDQGSSWGVHQQTGSFTLFQGTTWAGRNTTFDETHSFPSSLAVSGPTDYIFNKMGTTSTAGTTTISGPSSRTLSIIVNTAGLVSTQ